MITFIDHLTLWGAFFLAGLVLGLILATSLIKGGNAKL